MDPNSVEAAETQKINELYANIATDPYIFDKEDKIPFVNTCLHVAASTGQTQLAIEIRNLKPSLSTKLDPSGLSPLHLALLSRHFETVKGLINLDKNLIRVKGREMLTPLHHAAETEDCVDILTTFLLACPESIEDLNARGETALHIAVKKCNVRALEVLMGWIRKTQKHWVVYIQDRRGNTILHTAVSTSQPHIVESVARGCKNLRWLVNDKNLEGATAVDIAARLAPCPARTAIESILHRGGASKSSPPANDYSIIDYLISRETWVENLIRFLYFWRQTFSMEMRNTLIVVAALITTATFQAVLSPPGGSGGGGGGDLRYNSSPFGNESYINPTSSPSFLPTTNISQINATIFTSVESVQINTRRLVGFYALNTLAFIGSIGMIILVLPFRVFALLHTSLCFMAFGYAISLEIILPKYLASPFGELIIGIWYIIVIVCTVDIEDVFDWVWNIFCVSQFKRKRLQMLFRVVKN